LSNVSEFFGEHIQFSEVGEGGHEDCVGASPTMAGHSPPSTP
jgi:hypothetical protein